MLFKVYDVYVYGELDYNNMEKDVNPDPFKAILPPFKLIIEEPPWIVNNNAPSIDFLPRELFILEGTKETFLFGKAYDFEGNIVRLTSVSARSEQGNLLFDSWVSVRNSTTFEKIQVDFAVPKESGLTEEDIIIVTMDFIDDH